MYESATCAHCNEGYQRNLKHRPSRFCSRRCQSAALYLLKRGPVEPRTCTRCLSPISNDLRADAKFCSSRCRQLAAYERTGAARRVQIHGISEDDYQLLFRSQGRACAIEGCFVSVNANGRRLHIDHDHACCPGKNSCGDCIRGLLCDKHNVGIGMFADDPDALRAAADYLVQRRPRFWARAVS